MNIKEASATAFEQVKGHINHPYVAKLDTDGSTHIINVFKGKEHIGELRIEADWGYGYSRSDKVPNVSGYMIGGKYAPRTSKRVGFMKFSYNAVRRKHMSDALNFLFSILREATPAERLDEEMEGHRNRWKLYKPNAWERSGYSTLGPEALAESLVGIYREGFLFGSCCLEENIRTYEDKTLRVRLEEESRRVDECISREVAIDIMHFAYLAERKLQGIA